MNDAILDVQGLVGGYGKMTILNGTSFSVPAGSITTLIGPNGAGKSTVFKAIFGLLKLREGRVLFKGRDVTGLPQREVSNDFQVVQPKSKRTMKDAALFEGSLSEDVVLVPTKPGTYRLAVKPAKKNGGAIMDIQKVVLAPLS